MRLYLDAAGWRRARLSDDPDAMAWLVEIEAGRGRAIWAELLDEGTVLVHHDLNTVWWDDMLYSSCVCRPRVRCAERDDGLLGVRRRYTGRLSPAVLAAFDPAP